jgi:orotate phosphoribosyltransferase
VSPETLDQEAVLEILRSQGALRRGHFLLSSGRHSETYVEKARVFEDPGITIRLGNQIASWYPEVDVVVSPAVGAIPLGFAVALAAGARFVYAERREDRMALRRGFRLMEGERALVVEDVVTTGGSAGEVHALVASSGAHPLGVAALVDRSSAAMAFPLRALSRVEAPSFEPQECPLCRRGLPVEAPGSRQAG